MKRRVHVCTCGKEHKPGSRSWDPELRRCRNRDACHARVSKGMVVKPFVGDFDPEAAYRAAPKIGDAA